MTKPHNPWEEFLNNCATGDNHFRSSEYQELIDFIDCIQAENAALKEQVAQLQGACQLQLNINDTLHLKLQGRQSKVKVLTDALESVTQFAYRNICEHEETYRGGAIWEICRACGAKWADDEGGKPEFVEPIEITNALKALATVKGG